MTTKLARKRLPENAQTYEIFGKIIRFNRQNGIGIIKEHRSNMRFTFHASTQLCAEMQNGAPTLSLKKSRGVEKIHNGMSVVFFAEGDKVTGFSRARNFHQLEKGAKVIQFAKITIGRRSFKTPAWKARQMLMRWGRNGSRKVIQVKFFQRRKHQVAA